MHRHLGVFVLEDFVLLHASLIYNFVDKSVELDFIVHFHEVLHSVANLSAEDMQLLVEKSKFIVLLFEFRLDPFILHVQLL